MLVIKTISLVLFLSFSSGVYAQPIISISAYGGYSMPLSDMSGDYPDSLGQLSRDVVDTYLLSGGFNAGICGKYVIDSAGTSRLTAALIYSLFSNSKTYKTSAGRTTEIDNKMSIYTLSAGFEYSFIPSSKINPFI